MKVQEYADKAGFAPKRRLIPMGRTEKRKGTYYTPFYMPKRSPAQVRRLRLMRRCVLAGLSIVLLGAAMLMWRAGRSEKKGVMEVSAAMQPLLEVQTYPRIVDEYHPIDGSYEPDNLVSLNTLPGGDCVRLRADAAEQFLLMVRDMTGNGMAILPVRGYLTYAEHNALLKSFTDKYIAEGYSEDEAWEMARERVSVPGESEVQLGTLIEVATDPNAMEQFASTDQYRWLCDNAYRYGYVIRRGSRPWQLRYVGQETACTMRRTGLSLDDYVAAVKADNPSAVEEEK